MGTRRATPYVGLHVGSRLARPRVFTFAAPCVDVTRPMRSRPDVAAIVPAGGRSPVDSGSPMGSRLDVAAIVLAGGRSRRFGRDKLQAELAGLPLLHHTVRTAREVCDEVVVVAAHGGALPDLSALDARLVRDRLDDEGPLAGAVTGLGAVRAPRALLLAGDAPHVPACLLTALGAEPLAGALALSFEGRAWPMPSRLDVATALVAAERLLASGERRLRVLLGVLEATSLDEAWWRPLDPSGEWMRDVDRPEDLAS